MYHAPRRFYLSNEALACRLRVWLEAILIEEGASAQEENHNEPRRVPIASSEGVVNPTRDRNPRHTPGGTVM